jgi:GNAT superfamily N-acetyltransferase
MRLIQFLNEATRAFQPKLIDPALMTYEEYYALVNPKDKFHPSTAYDSDVAQLNQYQSASDYQKLLNTITRNGLMFEVREMAKDRWIGNYMKTTPDGDPVRDESNGLVYLNADEVKELIPEDQRFTYEHAVVEKKTGQIVGVTQDEWGTLLVMVASEFRRYGFGTLLVKLNRSRYPDRNSGGLTRAGAANLRRVHAAWVREYQESGFYSHLVKSGQITAALAKTIIASVTVGRSPRGQEKNHDTSNPADWLMMSDGQSYAILYDKKIYQIDEPDDHANQWLIDRHIIGMASLSDYGTGSPPMINRVYGITDQVKAQMLEVLMNQMVGHYIRMDDEYAALLRSTMGKAFQMEPPINRGDYPKYYTNYETKDWKRAAQMEKRYRKQFDPYDEWYARIIDWAENLGG